MKRIGSVVLGCVGVVAIGASMALAGPGTPNPNQVAAKFCTNELHAMGVKQFKQNYGDNAPKYQHAMRNCQRQNGKAAKNTVNNAAQQCKAEQADPNFAASHDNKSFDEFYGTNQSRGNGTGKNAFGKCVSGKVKAAQAQQNENVQNAAQQCRDERSQDPDAFKDKYGTNKNKKNAFGKCVSRTARGLNT
jgi:hypothetical protein